MKTSQIVIALAVVVLISIFAFTWTRNKNKIVDVPPVSEQTSIKGCYIAGTSKDVYTLSIQSENGENVSGTLAFKNFEKDSSSGTFSSTYKNGIILGDYTFQSEGTTSVMQVIFKKSGNDFIRGYGDVNTEGNRFTNLNDITYDSSSALSVFRKGECPDSNVGQGLN